MVSNAIDHLDMMLSFDAEARYQAVLLFPISQLFRLIEDFGTRNVRVAQFHHERTIIAHVGIAQMAVMSVTQSTLVLEINTAAAAASERCPVHTLSARHFKAFKPKALHETFWQPWAGLMVNHQVALAGGFGKHG